MKVELSEGTFRRLQALAVPLLDTVEDVVVRLLNQSEKQLAAPTSAGSRSGNAGSGALPPSPRVAQVSSLGGAYELAHLASLDGFQRVLWEEVVSKLPREFLLSQVYRNKEPLVRMYPTNQAMEATIRAGLQRLRDAGYIDFTRRGEYRKRA